MNLASTTITTRPLNRLASFLIGLGILIGLPLTHLDATTLWTGPTIVFTNRPGSNPTLEANQDRMTANVWITRGTSQGIYNAKTETSYTHHFSPADTEWAFGVLSNHASLSYTNWESWYGGGLPEGGPGPSFTVGKDAVLHLKTDDVYLSIKFLSWGGSGGGFSYVRSTPGTSPAPPAPVLANVHVANGSFGFTFTNLPGLTFTVVRAADLTTPSSNWTVAGSATESPAGQYRFTDPGATTNASRRFYRVRWP